MVNNEPQGAADGQQQMAAPLYKPTPEGIGGWLILPLIGLVITPFRMVYLVISTMATALTPEVLSYFDSPDSAFYSPLYKPLVFGEILVNMFIGAAAVVLLVLLFTKKKIFPMLMVVYLAFNACFTIIDVILAKMAVPQIALSGEIMRPVITSVLAACIWIPYFLMSERVKNTFVK